MSLMQKHVILEKNSIFLLVGILIADLLYAVADPRLRSRYA